MSVTNHKGISSKDAIELFKRMCPDLRANVLAAMLINPGQSFSRGIADYERVVIRKIRCEFADKMDSTDLMYKFPVDSYQEQLLSKKMCLRKHGNHYVQSVLGKLLDHRYAMHGTHETIKKCIGPREQWPGKIHGAMVKNYIDDDKQVFFDLALDSFPYQRCKRSLHYLRSAYQRGHVIKVMVILVNRQARHFDIDDITYWMAPIYCSLFEPCLRCSEETCGCRKWYQDTQRGKKVQMVASNFEVVGAVPDTHAAWIRFPNFSLLEESHLGSSCYRRQNLTRTCSPWYYGYLVTMDYRGIFHLWEA
jgi:hypothetical protein